MMDDLPPPLSQADAAEFQRRRRGRNWALFSALFGLAVLFFAITVVKFVTHR